MTKEDNHYDVRRKSKQIVIDRIQSQALTVVLCFNFNHK